MINRRSSLLFSALGSLLIHSNVNNVNVEAIVAGVDFGGEFFKIALVKPGTPFEIVTNIHSKRKTEVMVAWDGDDRLYGADAATVSLRKPQSSFASLRHFLGYALDAPVVKFIQKEEYCPYEIASDPSRGSLTVKHGDDTYHAEELVAMVFGHAKELTNTFAEAKVKDWVITVPSYFTQTQRLSILDAAEITGIRVLSLIDENTAAAVQYGIDRVYEEPFRVLYYNMGSSSLQVSLVEYSSYVMPDGFKKNKTVGSFDVLAKAWDTSLGGSAFDLRLTNFLADDANKKLKLGDVDIRSIPRAIAKIRAQARKTKIVLSANEQIPVVMQSLHNDKDFHSHVSRVQFEDMCADLFDRALKPVHDVLKATGLIAADIDEFEIIGGGVRMPKLRKALKSFNKDKDLGVHLNGDEAMALGAAFRAANISNAFRVRQVGMEDIYPFPIGIRLVDLVPVPYVSTTTATDSGDEDKEGDDDDKIWVKRAKLFKKNSRLGTKKSVSFKHERDFSCTFRYDAPADLPLGTESHISKFNITGLEAFVASIKDQGLDLGEPKVTLSYLLDSSGIVSIVKVEATLEEELPIVEEPVVVEEEKKNDTKTEDADKETKEEGGGSAKEAEESKDSAGSKSEEEKEKEPVAPKIKVHRRKLSVVQANVVHQSGLSILPMSVIEKKESVEMLKEMQRLDDIRIENAEAKNKLESYVYSSRDTLRSQKNAFLAAKVASASDLEALETEINDTEEWLYDDGENVKAAEYLAKHRSMQTKLTGMSFRLSEQTNRPAAVLRISKYLEATREMVTEWATTKLQVKPEEREKVMEKMDALDAWVLEQMTAQDKLAPHEAPAFLSSVAQTKLKELKRFVQMLSKRPKPEVPVIPVNATESANTTNADSTTTSTKEDAAPMETGDKKTGGETVKKEEKKDKTSEEEDDESEKKEDHSEL